jgi:hypothetical protein
MVAVLDQYEVEYKETYTSGTYDQVVSGKMFYETKNRFGEKIYVYGNRGVIYGSINSDQAPIPGMSVFDSSNSFSYRLQPYKEKAGNCRTAKILCHEERIYDTLLPDPMVCFKKNGASIFAITNTTYGAPGSHIQNSGVSTLENAFIMFDNYVPQENIVPLENTPSSNGFRGITGSINPGVDRHWTKSFPFEPRYSKIARQKEINYANIETNLLASFFPDLGIGQSSYFRNFRNGFKRNGLIVGTVGRGNIESTFSDPPQFSYKHQYPENAQVPISSSFFHRWAVDVNFGKVANFGGGGGPAPYSMSTTGSCVPSDLNKVLFGFGDLNTIFFDPTIPDANSITGYASRGTHKWFEFRYNKHTVSYPTHASFSFSGYEFRSGSIWSVGPIIRGWKYGLYNGLPDYTAAYYRHGRYGQYRDMLEQRIYTRIFLANPDKTISTTSEVNDGPITVKFVDSNDNLVDPQNTQSQNLSLHATSSLPYFDLQARNRPEFNLQLTNLGLINVALDALGNITV